MPVYLMLSVLIILYHHSFNEYLRLPERRLIFNINRLRQVVANAVSQSTDALTDLVKIAEGGSFRIIEASFRDGRKAIVRLPYPCTIPHKYGVASEVATMEFLRLHGIPIPNVLDWDSSVSNDVGSEYIIMERAPGKELENTWYTMKPKERMAAVEKIVDIEKLLFSIQFPASGSLYYKDSLGPDIMKADIALNTELGVTDKFCVGPSTEFLWWYQKRDELTVNRGPCKGPLTSWPVLCDDKLISEGREKLGRGSAGSWPARVNVAAKLRRETLPKGISI
jgi:hypothetical protein